MRYHLQRALLGRHPVEAGGATTAKDRKRICRRTWGRQESRKNMPDENVNPQS